MELLSNFSKVTALRSNEQVLKPDPCAPPPRPPHTLPLNSFLGPLPFWLLLHLSPSSCPLRPLAPAADYQPFQGARSPKAAEASLQVERWFFGNKLGMHISRTPMDKSRSSDTSDFNWLLGQRRVILPRVTQPSPSGHGGGVT